MKRTLLIIYACALGSAAFSQVQPPAPYGALPSERQLRWQETEMYCLVHWGANTYLDHEWGYGDEDPALLDVKDFDAEQIVSAAKAGGFKGVIVVAKHHDGLCLWPTATTTHHVDGDIVRKYQQACAHLGMKLGVYCSPWDRNSALYGTHDYVEMYRRQLTELETGYGPLFMVWHDGANGGDGYYGGARQVRKIDRSTYYGWDTTWGLTRRLQPGAAIFGDVGPDVRWVGNEEGHAGETYWATYTPLAPGPGAPANGYVRSELATEGTRHGRYWMPAECDVPLRPGWFYHASQDTQVKTPAQLLDLYFASVGRGACLDLGLAPNKQGRLAVADVESLRVFGERLRKTFAVNLAAKARIKASNVRGGDMADYGPAHLVDGDRYSYWATDDSVTTPGVELRFDHPVTFDVIRLRENIKLGQRVDSFEVNIISGEGGGLAGQPRRYRLIKGTSIGPNKLIRLKEPVTADKVVLRITGSPVCVALSDFGLFKEAK